MRKLCTKCSIEKSIDDFAWKNKLKNIKTTECKACHKIIRDTYYANNKVKEIKRIRERKKELREWFQDFKSTLKCENCDENHVACLDFHHRDPTKKDFLLSRATEDGLSKEKILEEVNKCQVLCANCHRKHHYEEKNAEVTQLVEY